MGATPPSSGGTNAIGTAREVAQGNAGDAAADAIAVVIEIARGFLGRDSELGPDTDLSEAGINSLAAVELSSKVQRLPNLSLDSTEPSLDSASNFTH